MSFFSAKFYILTRFTRLLPYFAERVALGGAPQQLQLRCVMRTGHRRQEPCCGSALSTTSSAHTATQLAKLLT
jgi:hypothetical protein